MRLIYLSEKFYEKYGNYPEILKNDSRPYTCLEIKIDGKTYAIPLRHHITHKYAFLTIGNQGLDYTKAVGGQLKIFVDCGIESGMDVFKALALGADAVCVGRALMDPLKEGAQGVQKKILAMNNELMSIMARTGAKDIDSIDAGVIHRYLL